MSWTKLSDTFGEECASLSDGAFRLHVEALCWVMHRERGPDLSDRDVRRFSEGSEDTSVVIAELVAVGWWQRSEWGYQVRHHMEHQPDPEVLAKRRENDAERQRRKRRRAAGLTTEQEGVTP